MFVTTPQSRLTPCQLPGRGAFWGATTNQKLSPFTGKVAWRSHDERGTTQSCQVPRDVPPLASLTLSSSPINGGAFWYSTSTAYSAVPLRGAIVSMGLRGSPGGLRGEIEIFPGPLAKRIIKLLTVLYLTPSVSLRSTAPSTGRLWVHFISFSLVIPQVAPICRQIIAFISFS